MMTTNQRLRRSLGIDIGGTSVKTALLEGERTVAFGQSEPYARPDGRALLAAVRAALPSESRSEGIAAVGLCVPGLFDRERGVVTLSANAPGLVGLDLAGFVREAVGEGPPHTWIGGDARAAAMDVWAERRLAGRVLALSLGTGVGACVLDDGAPLRVSGESPGHLGQIDVTVDERDGEPPVGPDGGRGGLEAYIGAPALLRRYGPDVSRLAERLGPDEPAFRALVRAIRIAHAIYRPRHVVLLGGVGIRLSPRAKELREAVNDGLTGVARPDWTLSTGSDGHHAARGAARLALAAPAERAPPAPVQPA